MKSGPEQRFDRLRTEPVYWYQRACELRTSALGLKDLENVGSVPNMLMGLSLELVLKAIILARTGELRYGHDLRKLALDAGLEVDDTEVDYLELLSAAVTWEGRYPVPKEFVIMERRSDAFMRTAFEPLRPAARLRGRKPTPGTLDSHFDQWWKVAVSLYSKVTNGDDS